MMPMLSVADLASSLAFYQDLLGGTEIFRFPDEDPEFVTLKLGESDLGIGPVANPPLHGQAQRPASGHRIELCVWVDDVDEVAARVRAAGAPVVMDPADQPWGERCAFIEDPDGNLLLLTARVAEAAPS
jgi:uncharacterized glyoxalase superfamily protein PhnB